MSLELAGIDDMPYFHAVSGQVIAEQSAVTFPEEFFRTHQSRWLFCRFGEELFNGCAELLRCYIVGVRRCDKITVAT
jgi:hypothetical protein